MDSGSRMCSALVVSTTYWVLEASPAPPLMSPGPSADSVLPPTSGPRQWLQGQMWMLTLGAVRVAHGHTAGRCPSPERVPGHLAFELVLLTWISL